VPMTRSKAFFSCFLLVATACSAAPAEDSDTSEGAYGTCPTNEHECPAWGATCSGATLETCVVDARGCRVKLTETCDLGCNAGACNTCRAASEPTLGSSLADLSAWYRHAVRAGQYVYVAWDERHGQYSGPGYGLAVVDVSTPNAPVATKTMPFAAGDFIGRLAVSGDRLYATQNGRLQIYDLADPTTPSALGSYAIASRMVDVSADGTIACVGADDGLHVIDVSKPAAPVQLALLATPSFRPSTVVCKNGFAAMAADGTLHIADLRVPSAPVLVADAPITGKVYDWAGDVLRFDGARVWIASSVYTNDTFSGAIDAFDLDSVASPPTLTRAGGGAKLPWINGIDVDGTTLSFRTSNAVGTIDVSTMSSPKLTKHVVVPDGILGMAHDGPTFFASGTHGITSIDVRKAPDVVLTPTNDWLSETVVVGSLAYMARGTGGLVISDMRNPKKPVILSTVRVHATSVSLSGSRAYVTVSEDSGKMGTGDELQIYDVASPWEPHLLGSYTYARSSVYTRTLWDVRATSSGRAYAVCDGGVMCTFDVSGSAPVLLGTSYVTTYAGYMNASAFAEDEDFLYLAAPDKLTVADMTDPTKPALPGTLKLGGYAGAGSQDVRIARAGKTVFVLYDCFYDAATAGQRCLEIIDVSTPAAPALLGKTSFNALFGQASGWDHDAIGPMRLVADRLYVATERTGVVVIDVSTVSAPKEIARLWTSAFVNDVFVTGRWATTNAGESYEAPAWSGVDQAIEICRP
jgi:hypothetical protein